MVNPSATKSPFQAMGLWRCWEAVRGVYSFGLTPSLTRHGRKGELLFSFTYVSKVDDQVDWLTGLLVVWRNAGADSPYLLLPDSRESALQCAALLSKPLPSARRWAANVLKQITPEKMHKELDAQVENGATEEFLDKLRNELRDHYDKKED
jgi:hypothetical protein